VYAHDFAAIFCSGDLTIGRLRPGYIGQFYVVSRCANDPVLAVDVYRALLRHGDHAPERFRTMLGMQRERPFALWWYEVCQRRRVAPIPS